MSSKQQDKVKQEGNALVQKQQFEQAATIYTKALELDSTSEAAAAIFSNRSLCNLNTKKYNEALQDAEKAISLRPTWFRGYQRAAAACEKLNNHAEGVKHINRCFELDEDTKNDETMKKMKEDFVISGITEKAPLMDQNMLNLLGTEFSKNQEYRKAIAMFTLAIEKDALCDEAAPILSNRSMAYFKIGKYKEAYEDAGCCCGIRPHWAKGFARRGVAAEKLEEWQIALESYDEYLKLDPQDEMHVTKNRNAVARVVADLNKEEEAKQKERQKIALDLENTKDPDDRVEKSYSLLISASKRFDIETMKIALKQPCNIRLDTPFNVNHRFLSIVPAFHPSSIESTRKTLASGSEFPGFLTVLADLIRLLGNAAFLHKVPLKRQVEYLDLLLDVAEKQDFSLAPNIDMKTYLQDIFWHDLSSPQHASIRKNLVITLFNRIDTARKVFHGKKASNKEFASDALFMMCTNFDPRREQSAHADVSSDVCTQDLYECICTAIEAGADPNINTIPDCASHTLESSITNLRSVKVVELLCRHNANPNSVGYVEERVLVPGTEHNRQPSFTQKLTPSSPMSLALCTYRPDLVRALLRFDAKLPTEKLPGFVLKCLPPPKNPLVKREYTSALHNTLQVFDKPHLRPFVTHEYVQLWFEIITKQNLSFVCPEAGGSIVTPLSVAISQNLDTALIETIIKLKPELLRQLYLPHPNERPLIGLTALGTLLHYTSFPEATTEYLQGVARVLMDHGIDFKKDLAQCYLQSDQSDKIESGYTGEAFVDGMALHGRNNEKMRMLKKFMSMKL